MSANKKFYKLTGAVFSDEPKFYSWDKEENYPYYEKLKDIDLGIHQFDSLDAAKEFFNTHYGMLKAGGGIQRVQEDGSPMAQSTDIEFIIFAVKGAES